MSAAATDIFFSSSTVLSSNATRPSRSRQYSSPAAKRQERQSLPRNQIFSDTTADSMLGSSSNVVQSAIGISRQKTPKANSSSTKRYVSSFKTLVNSTSGKNNQRVNYVNDSVIILKLSKENTTENIAGVTQISNKQPTLTMPTSTTPPLRYSSSSPPRFSPVLKVEGQKRRTAPNDFSVIPSTNTDAIAPSNPVYTMTMSAASHPSSNPSLFAYRSTLTAGTTVRPRTLAETATTSLFITTEKLKSNIAASMRPARQPLTTTTTTTMSSAYMPSQQLQRNTSQNTKPRIQQDKLNNSKDLYEYPDPFTNCPPEILNKLAQLTKLQLETVEWEKKRRFIKKKPITNGTTHGKDSP